MVYDFLRKLMGAIFKIYYISLCLIFNLYQNSKGPNFRPRKNRSMTILLLQKYQI